MSGFTSRCYGEGVFTLRVCVRARACECVCVQEGQEDTSRARRRLQFDPAPPLPLPFPFLQPLLLFSPSIFHERRFGLSGQKIKVSHSCAELLMTGFLVGNIKRNPPTSLRPTFMLCIRM